ncbi:hypothetical protein F5887DRAFT_1062648 [Amanita rubescens]|nr:hypothetical protein F5887DRAFT_1062648 [Amanita rubescens]
MNNFFSSVLGYTPERQRKKGLFGYTKAFYGCVEAQGRGTLHCHMLVWLEGALNPNEIRERLLIPTDKHFEKKLIDYLETNIATNLPLDPGDISNVLSSSNHPCSVRCVVPFAKDMHNLVQKCQLHTHSATCFKYCKNSQDLTCRFRIDAKNHRPHTTVDYETGEIAYQCQNGLINNYNQTIIESLRCNMDIKFIGSGTSAKAILYYITDYVSKAQLKMHVVYSALEIAINKLQSAPQLFVEPASEDAEQEFACAMIRKAANSIVALQELSAQQVALFSLCGSDCYTSHSFRRLFWRHMEEYLNRMMPLTSPESSVNVDVNVLPPVENL